MPMPVFNKVIVKSNYLAKKSCNKDRFKRETYIYKGVHKEILNKKLTKVKTSR